MEKRQNKTDKKKNNKQKRRRTRQTRTPRKGTKGVRRIESRRKAEGKEEEKKQEYKIRRNKKQESKCLFFNLLSFILVNVFFFVSSFSGFLKPSFWKACIFVIPICAIFPPEKVHLGTCSCLRFFCLSVVIAVVSLVVVVFVVFSLFCGPFVFYFFLFSSICFSLLFFFLLLFLLTSLAFWIRFLAFLVLPSQLLLLWLFLVLSSHLLLSVCLPFITFFLGYLLWFCFILAVVSVLFSCYCFVWSGSSCYLLFFSFALGISLVLLLGLAFVAFCFFLWSAIFLNSMMWSQLWLHQWHCNKRKKYVWGPCLWEEVLRMVLCFERHTTEIVVSGHVWPLQTKNI